jgi:hypothetical protein
MFLILDKSDLQNCRLLGADIASPLEATASTFDSVQASSYFTLQTKASHQL